MSSSSRLGLSYLAPEQSQKHVTVNEGLRRLDAIVQLTVKSRTTTAQPGSPADGDCYILPPGKTGAAWGPMADNAIAYFVDGAWQQLTPRTGWRAYSEADAKLYVRIAAGTWSEVTGSGAAGVAPNLLINGDFQINQRAFAGGALSAGVYGFDRWKAASGGANATLSGYTLTLASGELEQVVEPGLFGYASFASLAVTASVEDPSADLTVTFGSQSGTITAGSGRRSVTLTLGGGDSGNLSFKIKKASGSSVTFGRVKAEVGSAATAWQGRAEEAFLCRRYYERIVAQILGYNTAGQNHGASCFWQAKRTNPTMTRITNNYAFSEANCGSGPSTVTGLLPNGALFYRGVTSTGGVQFSELWEASAEL
ncbi:MAG: DUF2793 domain-containing protein [Parvularculaceae bacterium]|nr:DUF2793 domain-containing protein [Parvularculaceae bacterium]